MSDRFADLVGAPHVTGGRDPETGLDCYGLVVECYRRKGVEVPHPESGRNLAENAVLVHHHSRFIWNEVEKQDFVAVCFRIRSLVCHVGFTLPGERFIHTWAGSKSVVIERLSRWEHKIAGYYDYNPK